MQMEWGRGIGAERSMRRRAGRFGSTGEVLKKSVKTHSNTCKCPKCGYDMPKIKDVRCEQLHCPKCGIPMDLV